MKNEREIAELIFDEFRRLKCKTNEVIMKNSLQIIYNTLNPKEQDLFNKVLKGLQFTEYIRPGLNKSVIHLTEKGFDYIYDNTKINIMLKKPWIIPSVNNEDWDNVYNNLWTLVGIETNNVNYLSGPSFYKIYLEINSDSEPTYNEYIEKRKINSLSTSRKDYYKDLLFTLNDDEKLELIVKIQIFIESNLNTQSNEDISDSIITNNNLKNEILIELPPKVFISYSWDSSDHQNWVLELAKKLRENGIDVVLDKWEIKELGILIPHFMENAISESQKVICVLTPNYKIKTENLKGGVGYEYSIITNEIFTNDINTTKFIPIIRMGSNKEAIPVSLNGRNYLDMRNENNFVENFEKLLRDLHNEPKNIKPPIGKKPEFNNY